ncbi:MAG: hypothetical protein IJX37_10130 [Oscillospiraceae bacterium]|nr:hypothetical protein [Oscillospiraceae bacterium]
MDHSIRGYLERRSVEELDEILKKAVEQENLWDRNNTINLIMEIIEKRTEQNM